MSATIVSPVRTSPLKGVYAYRQEEVRDVVRDVHSNSHIREVKPVAQSDQRERNHMMQHQLLEILPRSLQLQHQHNRLLRPVTRL